ncbi:MAG: hypothetical protein F6K49_15700 [Moorea sp. SIO3I6]|nr:hypothetical protein [Moorena sp. SIO3I6]
MGRARTDFLPRSVGIALPKIATGWKPVPQSVGTPFRKLPQAGSLFHD